MRLRPSFHSVVLVTVLAALAIAFTAPASAAQDPPPQPGSIVHVQPASPQDTPSRIRIGANVIAANIIKQVTPNYPPIAVAAHICGTVVLHAIIAKDGTVAQLEYVSGPPLLLKAAADAVKQWQYSPTLLNGDPVEVDTTISVVFTLDGCPQGNSAPPSSIDSAPIPSTDMPTSPVDPQLKADIEHLLELNQRLDAESVHSVVKALRPLILGMIPSTPSRDKIADASLAKIEALFFSDDFKDREVAIYAKYLSDDDVKQAIQFFETPAGQHIAASRPRIAADMLPLGRQMTTENLPLILRQLCEEFPELRGAAKFCPDKEKDKTSLLQPAGVGTSVTVVRVSLNRRGVDDVR